MATQLFLRTAKSAGINADTHRGTNTANIVGTATGWEIEPLATTRGAGVISGAGTPTVTGATSGIEIIGSSFPVEWISQPVAADVTISGTITANIWAAENNMSANVAINVVIDIIRSNSFGSDGSNSIVQIVKSTRVTEEAVTTRAAANFTTGMTSGGYTSQTLNRGDRLRIRVFGDDAGVMASGFTFNIGWDGTTAAADGDSFVTFTENITFESAPAGSVLYLTDTASAVATAAVDKEAWTSRGSGVANVVTNTAAGWTNPIQVTDSGGGTVVDWFTRPLNAFTLTGMAVANLRALESNVAANASLRCEIARVDNNGTNATVWASWCIAGTVVGITPDQGELVTTEVARTANISGDDLAITDGQRLRIRVYIDDRASLAMGASQTVTFFYAGTSAAASGDSYITFPQTLTEFVTASAITFERIAYQVAVGRASVW